MIKILLVEDNEMNRDMLSRRLIRKGYNIVMAFDGKQAVEMACLELPDLILMDIGLPLQSGLDATREIRAIDITKNTPIIALTAHAMMTDRDKALAAGCDEFDTKPIEFKRLQKKITTLLSSCNI